MVQNAVSLQVTLIYGDDDFLKKRVYFHMSASLDDHPKWDGTTIPDIADMYLTWDEDRKNVTMYLNEPRKIVEDQQVRGIILAVYRKVARLV